MDIEKIRNGYLCLMQISDKGADIYGSEYSIDYLTEAGVTEKNLSTALLKMQLEQEKFFQTESLKYCPDSVDAIMSNVQQEILINLRDCLAFSSPEEQRGICLSILENIRIINGCSWTESERMQDARMPIDDLEKCIAAEITRYAGKLFADNLDQMAQPDENIIEGEIEINQISLSSAAAAAIAVYAECPDFREMPQLIANTSAASTYIAENVNDSNVDTINMVAFSMLLISAMSLFHLLIASSIATAFTLSGLVQVGTKLTWAKLTEVFLSFIELFKTELKLICGLGAAGLTLKGAAYLVEASSYVDSNMELDRTGHIQLITEDKDSYNDDDEYESDLEYLSSIEHQKS